MVNFSSNAFLTTKKLKCPSLIQYLVAAVKLDIDPRKPQVYALWIFLRNDNKDVVPNFQMADFDTLAQWTVLIHEQYIKTGLTEFRLVNAVLNCALNMNEQVLPSW